MEFTIEGSEYFNNVERIFAIGPHRRYLSLIRLQIKIFFCDKGLMYFNNDAMAV